MVVKFLRLCLRNKCGLIGFRRLINYLRSSNIHIHIFHTIFFPFLVLLVWIAKDFILDDHLLYWVYFDVKSWRGFLCFMSHCFALCWLFRMFCFLCFTSFVSISGYYTEVNPKSGTSYHTITDKISQQWLNAFINIAVTSLRFQTM